MLSAREQMRVIAKGAREIITEEDLYQKLKEQRPLIVKLGLDPSAPDIHLGHAVVLRKMRQLQDMGHRGVLIIGDFTGQIGDPTGKSKTRPQLTEEEVRANGETYAAQVFMVLDREKTDILYNSQWLSPLNFADVIRLAATTSVARMLEREDFKKRYAEEKPIGLHEFFYPLMQAYDSVAIKADIELGGTEQRFNILMGRSLQKAYGQKAQAALFMPLLAGLDGVEKMSKSLGNYIGIREQAGEMYGKVMSMPDGLMASYFVLATDLHPDAIGAIMGDMERGRAHPRDVKMRLAREITALYHGPEAARQAEDTFVAVFQKREMPGDIPEIRIDPAALDSRGMISAAVLICMAGFAPSTSEARRLIVQGAVHIGNILINDCSDIPVKQGDVLRVGRKRYGKITMIGIAE